MFDLPPRRFIAIASVSCASWLIDPYDIAPVAKRLTMLSTGSTSSMGNRRGRRLQLEQPAQRRALLALIVHEARVFLEDRVLAAPRRVLQLEHGVGVEQVILAVAAPLILAARLEIGRCTWPLRIRAPVPRSRFPRAMTSMPTPPIRDAVHVKYLSTNARSRPTASKICAPQ